MEHDTRGGIRMDSRYVSWERLDHFDGVLVRVHTLSEGVRGDFGSISIALTLLWALFTTMLLISWYVIRRMVSNMYVLQSSLQWQAWHDTLTRLYNRGALFEKARPLAKLCQTHQHPFSVIQVDIRFWILRCTHRTVQAHTHPVHSSPDTVLQVLPQHPALPLSVLSGKLPVSLLPFFQYH